MCTQEPYNLKNTPSNINRRQNIKVACFDDDLKFSVKELSLYHDKPEVELDLMGEPLPKAFLLNYMAFGYGKFIIDEHSFKHFEQTPLVKLDCRITRKQIYNILFDMTRTGHAAGSRVLHFIAKNLPDEKAEEILNTLLKQLVPVLIQKYVPIESQTGYNEKLFNACLALLKSGAFTAEST
jgi:hypothetical protein